MGAGAAAWLMQHTTAAAMTTPTAPTRLLGQVEGQVQVVEVLEDLQGHAADCALGDLRHMF